jgi:thymidylate synthase (FAD)
MNKKKDSLGKLVEQAQNDGFYDDEKTKRVLDKGFVRLVDSMGDDSAIVQAARVSYGKGTKKLSEDRGLIRYLIRNKHTTPLEMVSFKFHIRAPIFVFRQWHRHRTWSYNEMSGRYSEMPKDCYVPKLEHITTQDPNNKQGGTNISVENPEHIQLIMKESQILMHSEYQDFLSDDVRRELARINLPVSQYSEMYAKTDLHNLFHFLRLRMDSHAQFEIREYANAMYELIKPVVPIAAEAFEEYYLNSVTFNKKDLELLWHVLLQDKEIIEKEAEKLFENKREKSEAIAKITAIFDVVESEN